MAHEIGIQKLILQMDNEACVHVIKSSAIHVSEAYHITNECRKLIAMADWEVHLQHCYIDGNKVADKLANMGVLNSDIAV